MLLQTRPLPQILLFFQNNNLMDLKLQTEIYVNIERAAVYGRVSSVWDFKVIWEIEDSLSSRHK